MVAVAMTRYHQKWCITWLEGSAQSSSISGRICSRRCAWQTRCANQELSRQLLHLSSPTQFFTTHVLVQWARLSFVLQLISLIAPGLVRSQEDDRSCELLGFHPATWLGILYLTTPIGKSDKTTACVHCNVQRSACKQFLASVSYIHFHFRPPGLSIRVSRPAMW